MRPPRGFIPLRLRGPSLPPNGHINAYLVGERGALLVDPGSPFPAELRRVEGLLFHLRGGGGSLRGIFLTHHHGDHIGAAEQLSRRYELPIFAHAETLARLPFTGCAHHALSDGEELVLDEGRRQLVLLHTPGHAPGHLCLFEQERRVLLTGDMVLGAGTTLVDPEEGHMGDYLRSLERLTALDPGVVLPAHGPPITHGRAAIDDLIEHRRAREARVLATLRRDSALSALEVARRAYDELSPLLAALALRSTRSHLLELARHGAAHRAEKGWCATASFM